MKLTAARLKQIIKEELNKVLKEEDEHTKKRFNSKKEAKEYLNGISQYDGAEGDYEIKQDGKQWKLADAPLKKSNA